MFISFSNALIGSPGIITIVECSYHEIIVIFIFSLKNGKFPPKSLDLNPIEMIWNEKKEFVIKRNIQNDEEAVEEILEFQRKLTPAKCQAYINHLKKN
ncbi:Transposable element Tcb1 transposase [Brachionus plicatilis]|uniref:Transposable element Tcb1 transposase n=1 Tax=Brachionus plicatilis TaxID=10195 RepID=A0A3M7P6R4_BRAPC|nr:Transposable element Tcb1 transposase [Brachionus plicatilis]